MKQKINFKISDTAKTFADCFKANIWQSKEIQFESDLNQDALGRIFWKHMQKAIQEVRPFSFEIMKWYFSPIEYLQT